MNLNAADDDTITLGDGAGDTVSASTNGNRFPAGNTITVGNGDGDSVYVGIGGGGEFATGNTIVVGGGADDSVFFIGSDGTIKVGNGNADVVTIEEEGSNNNKITLGNGNGDVVNDSGSNDTITLGNGADTVTAGANSTITLGNGADTVTAISSLINGGTGHDSFVFTGSFGQDTITNFSPLHDNIVLAHAMLANFGAVQSDMTQVGANTVITSYDPADVITLTGVKTSSLHASDFRFV
ncbi:MAG TPA: hypothetical protein VJY34_01935 [Roseiarcus sp.]|nr:hypothetical protein [Roseiarcus sp.]